MRIAMLSVSLVLFFVILAIYVLNYQGSMDNLNRTMNTLIANEGVFHREEFDDLHSDRPDIAFSPRFFTVTFRAEGDSLTFLSVRLEEFDELTVSEAVSIVASLAEEKQRKGFYDKLMYRAETLKGGETLYVFLDASIQIDQFFQYLLISVLVALSSLFIVFVLIWALSKRMIRPFEENYRRQKRFITDAGHEIKTPLTIGLFQPTIIFSSCFVISISYCFFHDLYIRSQQDFVFCRLFPPPAATAENLFGILRPQIHFSLSMKQY